jgi:hypothetical protein
VAIPPTTTVQHPIKTKANVPMNSAIAFFIDELPKTCAAIMRVFSLYRNSNAEEDVRFWHVADIDTRQ